MSLGVFGGTFNPLHVAHLRLAEEAREMLGLRRVLFVPSASPPHRDAPRVSAAQRLEMVYRAIASNPSFEALTLELERPGPSFTVDTLQELTKQHPGERLWFLMGSDSLAELDTWREPERIFTLASIAVAARPDRPGGSLLSQLPPSLAGGFRETPHGLEHASGTEIRGVPFTPLAISASDVRRRIARGSSVRYLVPNAVIDYIEKHRLYEPDQEDS